jgi:hypothetical protein
MHNRKSVALGVGGLLVLCLFATCAASAGDVTLITPFSATASSTWAGTPGYVSPQYLIDGSGLSGSG